jgi:hypothetical protein
VLLSFCFLAGDYATGIDIALDLKCDCVEDVC